MITYTDIPQALFDLFNTIDFSQMTESDQKSGLRRLEEYAGRYLPRRNPENSTQAKRNAHRIAVSVPAAAVVLVCKFDYSRVTKAQQQILLPVFKNWMKNNLPLKQ